MCFASGATRSAIQDDLDSDDGFAAVHLAAIRGHASVLKRLIGLRADVDVPSRDGDTPLMWAAHLGKMDVPWPLGKFRGLHVLFGEYNAYKIEMAMYFSSSRCISMRHALESLTLTSEGFSGPKGPWALG